MPAESATYWTTKEYEGHSGEGITVHAGGQTFHARAHLPEEIEYARSMLTDAVAIGEFDRIRANGFEKPQQEDTDGK